MFRIRPLRQHNAALWCMHRRLARGAGFCTVLPRCGDSSAGREFPSDKVHRRDDRGFVGVESLSPHEHPESACVIKPDSEILLSTSGMGGRATHGAVGGGQPDARVW